MKKCNVILTGIPRSGTTLTCNLLNKLPDTVALHEPMDVLTFPQYTNHDAICDEIDRFFQETRISIRDHAQAISKQFEGEIPENPMGDRPANDGLRRSKVSKGVISIRKDLSSDFLLCIKHPVAFTAILENLVQRFPSYAVIRNPLSVLASWNSVDLPVGHGHAPAAEALDKGLEKALGTLQDKVDRQLYLLSWFYEKFKVVLPPKAILRYEDIVSSGGSALSVITPLANRLEEKFESKNKNELYDRKGMATLGKKLLNADGAFWEFYSKESVETLIQ